MIKPTSKNNYSLHLGNVSLFNPIVLENNINVEL